MDIVNYDLDKRYAPHMSQLTKQLDTQRSQITKGKETSKMTSPLLGLALQQVLVRLKEMEIINWHSWFSNETDIYIITIVTDGTSKDPINLELKDFPHIKRGDKLSIGAPYGVMMYKNSGVVPEYLDMRILVARNKQSLRDAGKALQDIHDNKDFQDAVTALSSILNGPAAIVTGQIDNIIGIIGSILSIQKDDKLLYYAVTVSKEFDDLGIGIHCDQTDFVKFCYQIQVGKLQ